MQAIAGGNVRYPNLQAIADLFRSEINDTFNNTQGSGVGTGNEAGLIMPNSNPDLLNFMNSAIMETYADLRNVGDPELVIDNYLLLGIPPLTTPDPAVQVALGYAGFFDGYMWHPQWTLPIGASKILQMQERQSGSNWNFNPMKPAPFGLQSCLQGNQMCYWEMREGMVWMPGALVSVDLRLRARITYPPFLNPATLNFQTAYVPILDSLNAIEAKMEVKYARRFAPDQYLTAKDNETEQMNKLKLEVVRQMQVNENQRAEFGAEAVTDFNIQFAWL